MCDMPASETERLIDFDTGTLYEAAGEGAFAPGLQALSGDGRVAGPALTVACPPGDNLAVHVAVAQARQGEILVVQTHDWGYGVWGEVLTVAAMARGVRALVIDGSVQCAHRLLQRRLRIEAVGVEDVHVVQAHPEQALVETGEQVLA